MLPEFFTLRNWDRFCLYLNNQRSHGQMDATAGFSASNWSKTNPPRFSESRLLRLYKGMKVRGRHFSPSEIGDVFVCNSTTSAPMDKWMLQADSAHQTGLKPTLHAF